MAHEVSVRYRAFSARKDAPMPLQTSRPAPEHFATGMLLALAWVTLVVGVSIVFRRKRGKPLFRPDFPNLRFLETWCSGRSLRNPLTRLGGASGCLWVAVTDAELLIVPHFPFNLMFLPEIYRLEHRLRGGDILSVEPNPSLFSRKRVLVTFRNADGTEEAMQLHLNDVDGFRSAVNAIRASDVN
jgi:hypothetical protein